MSIFRSAAALTLLVWPVWADDSVPVFGARAAPHHSAPLPIDGEGDYGFAGPTGQRTGESVPPPNHIPPGLIPPDEALLAYDEEEARLEAEAALVGKSTKSGTVID